VHVLQNGSIVTWSQPLYPGSLKPLFMAKKWGDPFVAITPTIHFPQYLLDRAKEANATIKLDDPTLWIDRRGYWHVLAHNGDGPFPCGDGGHIGQRYRDGNPNAVGCSAHL
jgi:hypothetical protein